MHTKTDEIFAAIFITLPALSAKTEFLNRVTQLGDDCGFVSFFSSDIKDKSPNVFQLIRQLSNIS